MKLKAKELCPIHHRLSCCGRADFKRRPKFYGDWIAVGPGVKRNVKDGREKRSPAAMRRLLAQKVQEQHFECGICHAPFMDAREIVADHIEPRGMNGGKRDDSPRNIQATHSTCNLEKGSQRL